MRDEKGGGKMNQEQGRDLEIVQARMREADMTKVNEGRDGGRKDKVGKRRREN